MNKRWFALVLMISMIPGCSENRIETAPSEALYETKPTETVGFSSFYEAESTQAVQLETRDTEGFRFIGDDILVFSGYPHTRLMLLDGDTFAQKNELRLPFHLAPSDPGGTVSDTGITYVDKSTRELVFLDAALNETNRVPLPEGSEAVFLSPNGQHLYYCTLSALRVVDLALGTDRPVAEMAFPTQEITGLYCDGAVIGCRVLSVDGRQYTRFLSAETGRLLHETEEDYPLWTAGDLYLTFRMDGAYRQLLCGTVGAEPAVLATDAEPAAISPILSRQIAVLHHPQPDGRTQLDAYQLDTGLHIARVTMPADYEITDIQPDPETNTLWMLCHDRRDGQDSLYRWDLDTSATVDSRCYLQPRWNRENPDLAGLEQCRADAENLSEQYGVQILLWTDCPQSDGDTHRFEPEYQVSLIRQMLRQLELALAQYPDGFLNELSAQIGGIRICLARSITPGDPAGFLYRDQQGNARLMLVPNPALERQTHRMLLDLAASRVLAVSDAYDSWDRSAPTGSGHRERVAILEAAMTEEQAIFFTSNAMQADLRLICFGIRETFRTAAAAEQLPWEQYLTDPAT